jgi:hypothetical protein
MYKEEDEESLCVHMRGGRGWMFAITTPDATQVRDEITLWRQGCIQTI